MTDHEDIAQQKQLLSIHRRMLAHLLSQKAIHGAAHTPPSIIFGIEEARTNIRRTKKILRDWGEIVSDHPDDEDVDTSSVQDLVLQTSHKTTDIAEISPVESSVATIAEPHYDVKTQTPRPQPIDTTSISKSVPPKSLSKTTSSPETIQSIPNPPTISLVGNIITTIVVLFILYRLAGFTEDKGGNILWLLPAITLTIICLIIAHVSLYKSSKSQNRNISKNYARISLFLGYTQIILIALLFSAALR